MCDRSNKVVSLAAVTATTTWDAILVGGAELIGFLFTRANHGSGSSAFTVEGSFDGTVWFTINMLRSNVTNTNAQQITRVASVSIASNASTYVSLSLEELPVQFIRVTVTETTDGTHSGKVFIKYD